MISKPSLDFETQLTRKDGEYCTDLADRMGRYTLFVDSLLDKNQRAQDFVSGKRKD